MKHKTIISLFIFLIGFVSHAMANPYVGVGVGKVDHDLDTFDEPIGYEVYLGYKFNDFLAVEGSYTDFGDSEDDIAPVWTLSGDTWGAGIVFIAPVTELFDLYGKIGVHSWEFETEEEGFGKFAEADGTDLFYGFGANFNFNELVSLGARYMVYEIDDDEETTMVSANLQFNF